MLQNEFVSVNVADISALSESSLSKTNINPNAATSNSTAKVLKKDLVNDIFDKKTEQSFNFFLF